VLNCSNYEDDAVRALGVVQGPHWTVYCHSTEQDEHYALIKYNNYLYSMQLIFTLLAKKKKHLNFTRQINYKLAIAISMGKVLFYCCFESYICFCSAVRITLCQPNKQCLIALYCTLWNVFFLWQQKFH